MGHAKPTFDPCTSGGRRARRLRGACSCSPDGDPDHVARRSLVHHLSCDGADEPRRHGDDANGKTAKVDLRCDGTVGLVVKANVAPNAAGDFSTTIAPATMAKLVAQSCVLRAVPANHPSTSPAFAGVRLLVGDVRLIALKGGPGNGGVIDYRVRAPQLTGRGMYASAGTCGVQGSATFSAGFTTSDDVFTCAARLANTIGARSAIQVDGVNSFTPAGAATLFAAARRSRTYPTGPLTVAVSTRPGDGQPDDPRVRRRSSSARPTRRRGPSIRRPAPASCPRASGSIARSRRAPTVGSPP